MSGDRLDEHDDGAVRLADVATVTAELADLSGRLLRFEPVTPDELAAFAARREGLLT